MMVPPRIISIVEGPGDKAAVPVLLRRVLWERLGRYDVLVSKAIAAKGKPNLTRKLTQFLRYAILEGCEAILIVLDADRDCPRDLAFNLAQEAFQLNLDVPVAIACANHEYETWFICSLTDTNGQGIRDRLGLADSVTAPGLVEEVSGAKAWLDSHMPRDRAYKETFDQEHLTYHIDLSRAHDRSRSFRRLCHAVDELVEALDNRFAMATPKNSLDQ